MRHTHRSPRLRWRRRTVAAGVLAGLAAGAVHTAPQAGAAPIRKFVAAVGHLEMRDADDGVTCDPAIGESKIIKDSGSFTFRKTCGDLVAEVFFTVTVKKTHVNLNGWISVSDRGGSRPAELGWAPFATWVDDNDREQIGPKTLGQAGRGEVEFEWTVTSDPGPGIPPANRPVNTQAGTS